jgi:predicted transcriptional regulator of viral defense system
MKKELLVFFKQHKGYARLRDVRNAMVHPREMTQAVNEGEVEKVKPGLYKLVNYNWDENNSMIDVCQSNKTAVICLLSALAYYELTTFNPSEITVAVPNNTPKFKLDYPPIQIYYFSDSFYPLGIEEIKLKHGIMRIYNKEKTICDMFRYRKKVGEDLALEGLKNYLQLKEANINKLLEYSEKCKVKTIIMPYLKAIIAR